MRDDADARLVAVQWFVSKLGPPLEAIYSAIRFGERTIDMIARSWLLVLGFALCAAAPATADPNGGGGTAIYPVMSLWAEDYHARTGQKVNYQPIGSGGGIRQSLSRTIDFGNTDLPLAADALVKGKLIQFPVLFIAIVPVVNLPGIAPGALVLDGPTLADIFLGRIRRWNAAPIARLNPGLALPNLPVIVVHRSDASGTTAHFAAYLTATSQRWAGEVGVGPALAWPTGSAGKGNAGVVATLQETRGAIGYVEYAYAQQNRLTYTALVNRAGTRVAPTTASFRAAAQTADFRRNYNPIQADPPGRESWPLTAATYMLLHADAPATLNRQIIGFLRYALHDGRRKAESLHYVPLPEPVVAEVEAAWVRALNRQP
jgi:phosphate transport system substrate-binding protein